MTFMRFRTILGNMRVIHAVAAITIIVSMISCSSGSSRSRETSPQNSRTDGQASNSGNRRSGPAVPASQKNSMVTLDPVSLRKAISQRRFAEVEQACTGIRSSKDPKVWFYCGSASAHLGHDQKAETLFRRALQMGARFPEVYVSLTYILTKSGRIREAMALLDEALRRFPKYPDLWYNKGAAAERLGDRQAALSHYSQAILLNKNHGQAILARGELLFLMKRYREAQTDFERLLGVPGFADTAREHLAFLMLRTGHADKAWNHVKMIKKQTKRSWRIGTTALMALGRFKEAAKFLEPALSQYPNDIHLRLQYAAVMLRIDPARSLDILKDRKEPAAVFMRCQALFATGKQNDSVQCFRDFVKTHPDHPLAKQAKKAISTIQGGTR